MSKSETLTGTVLEVKKIASSGMGNPRYSFHVSGHGWVRTSPNLGAAYGLTNDFRVAEPMFQRVRFELNGRGHVVDWQKN